MRQAWNPLYLTFNAPLRSLSTLFFYLIVPFAASRLLRIEHIKLAIAVLCLVSLLPPLYVISSALGGNSLDGPSTPLPAVSPAGIPVRHSLLQSFPPPSGTAMPAEVRRPRDAVAVRPVVFHRRHVALLLKSWVRLNFRLHLAV